MKTTTVIDQTKITQTKLDKKEQHTDNTKMFSQTNNNTSALMNCSDIEEVFPEFVYFDAENESINIVELMNLLAFGGDPFKKFE